MREISMLPVTDSANLFVTTRPAVAAHIPLIRGWAAMLAGGNLQRNLFLSTLKSHYLGFSYVLGGIRFENANKQLMKEPDITIMNERTTFTQEP
ncbi:MAG: hypothetical protein H8E66_16125 [Planctomycetes bacterium]|nr:hypothetical protein [Planctomycetota bacterium]